MTNIQNKTIVTVGDCKELSAVYDVHELLPYAGRTGVVVLVDEGQGEALVRFFDYFNEDHHGSEPENWFPLTQLELTDFDLVDIAEHK